MASPENTIYQMNVAADDYAAEAWNLSTHFADREFALSGSRQVIKSLRQVYRPGPIDVIGLGSGTAMYDQVVCAEAHAAGFDPRLIVTDMQAASVRAVPASEHTLRLVADSTRLPISGALYADRPRVVISRAFEHYLSDAELGRMFADVAGALKPGEVYFSQLSSGDQTSLRGFEHVLARISGKEMRYFTPQEYIEFVHSLRDHNQQLLFSARVIGHANDQPRDSVDLAKRYLNTKFLLLNPERVKQSGLHSDSIKSQLQLISDTEKALSQDVRSGMVSKDAAVTRLEETISGQPIFDVFRETVVATVKQHLATSSAETSNLTITEKNGENVRINVTYPIVALQRLDS